MFHFLEQAFPYLGFIPYVGTTVYVLLFFFAMCVWLVNSFKAAFGAGEYDNFPPSRRLKETLKNLGLAFLALLCLSWTVGG
jgi:hypothetical protein